MKIQELPYTGPDDPALPPNVRSKSAAVRKQWVAIWNSTYSECIKTEKDKKTCEGKAFRIANGVIKKKK